MSDDEAREKGEATRKAWEEGWTHIRMWATALAERDIENLRQRLKEEKPELKSMQRVFLVMSPFRQVFGVFANSDAALDFKERFHGDDAIMEERNLHFSKVLAVRNGYVE